MGISVRTLVAYLFGCVITACATVPTYNMKNTQDSLSDAMKQTDSVTEKAMVDLKEKKLLVNNLARGKTPAFRSTEADLRSRLTKMDRLLSSLAASRKRMNVANSDVVSLGYSRTEVREGQSEYNQVQSSVKEFQTAVTDIDRTLEAYTRESNALTTIIENNKLLIKFEPNAFVQRVQGSVRNAQQTSASMQEELTRAEKAGQGQRSLQSLARDLQHLALNYTQRAQRYQGIANEVRNVTADIRITSLDPEWPKVQRLVQEFEKTDVELAQLHSKFVNNVEKFHQLARKNSAN